MAYYLKNYTEKQYADFVIEYNHKQGLNIEFDGNKVIALLPYEKFENGEVVDDSVNYNAELLAKSKLQKKAENQQKLDIARTSHSFTVTLQNQECEFDTKDKTQSDLNSAAISASIGQPWLWTTNNRITLSLTSEDILAVSSAYAQAVNGDIAKWTEYEALIEQAQTTEDVQEIEIVY